MHTYLKNKVLAGEQISIDEAKKLIKECDTETLCESANEIRKKFCANKVDTCSIINARSGKCTENCKWCAQSRHFKTGVNEYEFVDFDELKEMANHNDRRGVKRFSLVTSGRKVNKAGLEHFCKYYEWLRNNTNLYLCASMGLLNKEEMTILHDAGVQRYHCNLETSASYFSNLCTTHTSEDKKKTIRYAQELRMEVCSGGIIGMGESMENRIELAFELRELGVKSVPINILNPIPGTPLENVEKISDDEIRRTVAIFRFILPDAMLRFAGGRARLSHELLAKILNGGMNGALIGDMLTTVGNRIDEDFNLFDEVGMDYK